MRSPVVTLVVLLCALPALADISPDVLGAGPSFAPPGDNPAAQDIVMAKEKVILEVHTVNGGKDGGFVVVDATFSMKAPPNSKGATSLTVAFPGDGVRVGDAYVNHAKLFGFHAWVDGKPVASKADEKSFTTTVGPPNSTYKKTRSETWHTFPASVDDDTVIRVRYAVAAEPMSYEEKQTHAKAQYILHTGGAWKDKIGEAVVEVKGVDVDLTKTSVRTLSMPQVSLISLKSDGPPPPVSPPNTVRTKTSITTTWTHLEPAPNDDIEVVFPCPREGWSDNRAALEKAMESAAR